MRGDARGVELFVLDVAVLAVDAVLADASNGRGFSRPCNEDDSSTKLAAVGLLLIIFELLSALAGGEGIATGASASSLL